MKDKISGILKNVGDIKDKVTKTGKGAAEKAGIVKKAVESGVKTGKAAFEKTAQSVNKQKLSQGVDATAKGIDIAAKGARLAQKGVETLAGTMEKAAEGAKKLSRKLKD